MIRQFIRVREQKSFQGYSDQLWRTRWVGEAHGDDNLIYALNLAYCHILELWHTIWFELWMDSY